MPLYPHRNDVHVGPVRTTERIDEHISGLEEKRGDGLRSGEKPTWPNEAGTTVKQDISIFRKEYADMMLS
jgi:hypothetical protein